MTREILFRGKRTDNDEGEFVYGIPVEGEPLLGMGKRTYIITKPGVQWVDGVYMTYDECVEVDPDTIGQFAGLTDKNGVRIFEGDILRVTDEHKEYITFVRCVDNTLCVDIFVDNTGVLELDYEYTAIGFAEGFWKNQSCKVEIIGNIHDNPELLEVSE